MKNQMTSYYNFYVTEFNPNGTQSLIITDDDRQVIQIIDEAIFGLNAHFAPEANTLVVCDTDNVFGINPEHYEEMDSLFVVAEVSRDQVLSHIAVSPVNDGEETLEAIKQFYGFQGRK